MRESNHWQPDQQLSELSLTTPQFRITYPKQYLDHQPSNICIVHKPSTEHQRQPPNILGKRIPDHRLGRRSMKTAKNGKIQWVNTTDEHTPTHAKNKQIFSRKSNLLGELYLFWHHGFVSVILCNNPTTSFPLYVLINHPLRTNAHSLTITAGERVRPHYTAAPYIVS